MWAWSNSGMNMIKEKSEATIILAKKMNMQIGIEKIVTWVLINGLMLCISCNAQSGKMDQPTNQRYIHVSKSYEREPVYTIHISSSGCGWEILLNDVPIKRILFKSGGTSEEYPLNAAITQSGEQELKIRVYPLLGKDLIKSKENFKFEILLKDAINATAPTDTLLAFPGFEVTGGGQPYLEYTKKFNASVPYTLEGWQNSVDLTQLDSSYLNDLLWKAYAKIEHSIKNKDIQLFSDNFDVRQKNWATANYLNYDAAKELYENGLAPLVNGQGELEPVQKEDFKCHFFAHGKIVVLEKLNTAFGNGIYFSPIITKIPNTEPGDNSIGWFTGAMFHLPKGSKELEVIWE